MLRKKAKEIDVYLSKECVNNRSCVPLMVIKEEALFPLGINEFTPLKMVTSIDHRSTMFIECEGFILILGVKDQNLLLINKIVTGRENYSIGVNKEWLSVISDPNIIEVYWIGELKAKREVQYMKKLPLYGYQI